MEWDGRAESGEYVASSRPAYTITATSSLGESSVSGTLVVDLYQPKIFAQPGKATLVGTGTRVGYKVSDPFSAQADVSYVVTDAKGRRIASGRAGRVATGQSLTITWKPAARGSFTVAFHAADLAGNHEASPAHTVVTVR